MRLVHAALAAVLAASCRVVDSKAWNLGQLHEADGRHKYTGVIEGDFEYYLRHVLTPSLTGGNASLENKAPAAIEDPSSVCLENLLLLEEYNFDDPRNLGIQVEWFSRLAVADPSRVSRERAVLGLGRAGARVRAGNPVPFPKDSTPAGPNAISEALAGLLRAAQPVLANHEKASESEQLDLASACQVIQDLPLDLDGARRMLHAAIDVAAAAGFDRKSSIPLAKLAEDLERRCIRFGLAAGLKDQDPLVRGAAVEASVECVGTEVLDPILAQLATEMSEDVVVRVLALVRTRGLSEKPPEGTTATPEALQRARESALYRLLERPESRVRVAAMLALDQVTGAKLHSLREEDWQGWWLARPALKAGVQPGAQPSEGSEPAPEKHGP